MATTGTTSTRAHPLWPALIGPTTLGVLRQGLRAGLLLRRDADGSTWSSVHQHADEATVIMGGAVWLPVAARRR
jgi:hypothetical protein